MPNQDKPRSLQVGEHRIDDASDCYVIAEIGHNHQGSVEQARELFREAKAAGAHAVKLQKRDNRSLYTHELFNQPYENENSYGPTYGEHREALEFGRSEYEELQAYAQEHRRSRSSPPPSTSRAPTSSPSLDMPALQDRLGRPASTRRCCATSPGSASR